MSIIKKVVIQIGVGGMEMVYDYMIVGGGIVGLSTGYALIKKHPRAKVLIVEKEPSLAAHQ